MGEDSGEKTEEPTPHKLKEAREKGQIAKGRELTGAILLFVSFYTLKASAANMWNQIVTLTNMTFEQLGAPFTISTAGDLMNRAMYIMLATLLPVMGATVLVAIISEALQTGFLFAPGALEPKLDKLNPLQGLKNWFSMKQLVELFKNIGKMFIVIVILYYALRDQSSLIINSMYLNHWQLMSDVGSLILTVVTRIGIFYLIIASLDFFYQRYEYTKQMRMSMKEIKDEYKRLEGDPLIKQRQRNAQMMISQGRQSGQVPNADVVVTNPTHFAIAIRYKVGKMRAPIVLAKGRRLFAKQIKAIAEFHGIPVVENPVVAQALYRQCTVGHEIPADLYQVVAEILAYVYNLKRSRRKQKSKPSTGAAT